MADHTYPDGIFPADPNNPWNQGQTDDEADMENKLPPLTAAQEELENERWQCAQAQNSLKDLWSRLYNMEAPTAYIGAIQAIGLWLSRRGDEICKAMQETKDD